MAEEETKEDKIERVVFKFSIVTTIVLLAFVAFHIIRIEHTLQAVVPYENN